MLSMVRRRFSIFLTDGFSLMAFTSLTTPLRIANDVLGYQAYSWNIVSHDGRPVRSSCGVSLSAECDLDCARNTKAIDHARFLALLPGDKHEVFPARLISWVREAVSRGVSVAGVGRGALVLAEHGLLDGRRCAVHWSVFAPSIENFPQVVFSRAYYEIDGLIHTCAGEAAAFDLVLEIIKQDFGQELIDSINEIALQGRPRSRTDRQAMALHMRLERMSSPLLAVVKLMERTVSAPLTMEALAASSGMSRRRLQRLFQQHLGTTPRSFYRQLRIERAQALLENSTLPVIDVAMASGFVSQSHFTKVYKAFTGCTPQETRTARKREGGLVGSYRERAIVMSAFA
ncbi:transcriptional regulator GlxA family with amidase domain [Sinorhizobium fredii]|uniref:Transcriptional regulator, AraC family n=1 Tax=Sinorhizobium fredii (strain USDA 257) TaxID=1185652 RepID=I3X564_SINF2|nr:GlxA family transcriptional regulator [Sinorhizobium fredii]AFL51020.1 transcriptional regulator, AraC family [Sinorhizobium fredii USDA 257]